MAICTQQLKISLIGLPIFEAAAPRPKVAGCPDFCTWVDVVNLKCANIRKSAGYAFTTKLFYQGQFSSPYRSVFVQVKRVAIPVIFSASLIAKTLLLALDRFFALLAVIRFLPSCRKVARLRTIFPRTFVNSILVHLVFFCTNWAGQFYACLFHVMSIAKYIVIASIEYFEIACRRIREAYAQPDMFVEQPKPMKQESLI